MAQTVREIMTLKPVTFEDSATVFDAAQAMRDSNIGDVIVVTGGSVRGVLTDRDIVVRVVAEGRDPHDVKLGEVLSAGVVTANPDDSADSIVTLMREKAIRRVPVVEGSRPVGIVSIGDLASEKDNGSALADISSAPPNH
jgi:CBS domain-containing protein